MGFLAGKKAVVTGIASDRSIAYGIANALAEQGASLILTYQGDKLADRVGKIGAQLGAEAVLPLDVARDEDIDTLFDSVAEYWSQIDILVHAIGFAPREALAGGYLDSISRDASNVAHDISAYSFAALAKSARPMLSDNASLITMTYLGSERAMPGYNIMGPAKASLEANMRFIAADLGPSGVRVNAISAGPIKTLAASGIEGFRDLLTRAADMAPLQRNVTQAEIGNTAAFLGSDLASGITGEVLYVDAGYNMVGAAHTANE
ncbi:enoyl-ACP reductase [Salinisphaera sp. USBA-960]|uniref:enoyl-ACP reductase FabI n=1 Tax=Salinisphaera orenii TaxID=856731 RepID=UPI000DBE7816|nr:enoyl-ACP reductase [Salifodinibacter halophilus]NNC25437.1 enoyl-ACP reductase [Salifodinibacter halophilus]